jgi:hypothetical protein
MTMNLFIALMIIKTVIFAVVVIMACMQGPELKGPWTD